MNSLNTYTIKIPSNTSLASHINYLHGSYTNAQPSHINYLHGSYTNAQPSHLNYLHGSYTNAQPNVTFSNSVFNNIWQTKVPELTMSARVSVVWSLPCQHVLVSFGAYHVSTC